MTFPEYLLDLRRKNPDMPMRGRITLDIEEFERTLERAFLAGSSGWSITDWIDDLFNSNNKGEVND